MHQVTLDRRRSSLPMLVTWVGWLLFPGVLRCVWQMLYRPQMAGIGFVHTEPIVATWAVLSWFAGQVWVAVAVVILAMRARRRGWGTIADHIQLWLMVVTIAVGYLPRLWGW